MSPNDTADHYDVEGAHGTIAEQIDEAFLDDRSDASDDIEKGRLKFPKKIYGRERELETLLNIYNELTSSSNNNNVGNFTCLAEKKILSKSETKEKELSSSDRNNGSHVVFLSGYSGIGKSALVDEFVKQVRCKYQSTNNNDGSPILYATGKYTEQSTASAPFSAISEVFEQLVSDLSRGGKNNVEPAWQSNIQKKIRDSDLIGTGAEGNRILRTIFPSLGPLLDDTSQQRESKDELASAMHPSMNAIKECTKEILSKVCGALAYPLVIFLDDLQWGDGASIEMLEFLLSCTKLRNILFICAYRSNEVDAGHLFNKLMENVTKARRGDKESNAEHLEFVERLDLFSLSPEAITKFIADSIKKEDVEGVRDLAEAVYGKTMGNIFFTKQALEELVRKNVLFYDVMCFEWRFVVSKVELANYMSDDVVETVKGKIKELSIDIQQLLVVMAYIPNAIDVPLLRALVNFGEYSFEEGTIRALLVEASDEGLLILSTVSGCYVFAHDRIRQASLEFSAEKDQDELLLHISCVLQNFASQSSELEWCLYVAVDLLNAIPSDKTNCIDLIKLNLKVSKIARSRGSRGKENELLHKGLKCLESTGNTWKQYSLALEIYNAVIISDYGLGLYSNAKLPIDSVLNNAKSLDDKLQAYLHKLLCEIEETSDYTQGVSDGVKILNRYGFDIPTSISNTYIFKESAKLKMALRNRSYHCLAELSVKDEPIFDLFSHVQKYALYTSNEVLVKVLAWKAIRHAIKRGMDRQFPVVVAFLASSMAKHGHIKTSQELGYVSIALTESDKISDDVATCSLVRALAYGMILPQLQSFLSIVEPLLQCHRDLKLLGGQSEYVLGTMMAYSESYLAAGLELGPLLESKLLLAEELCQSLGRSGFLTTFQILRQLAINLRTRTEDPTEFKGVAFKEEKELNEMNPNARKMAIRDSTSSRLQLALVFWDEEKMAQMLERLCDFPLSDTCVARLHSRLCFTGLASLALSQQKCNESFAKLGNKCLEYFARLTKHGSVNAKPAYLFMLAIKCPSRKSFLKAIDACAEARMIHLEAMAKERFAVFLRKENDMKLANEYLTSSYWLYQDWGAHAKALHLSQEHNFLTRTKKDTPLSVTLSTTISQFSSRKDRNFVSSYSFNTTFQSRKKILVKQ